MRLYSFDEFRKKYGMGRVQVHRKDLHEQLMHAASGTKIRLGTTVESITETEDKIKVQFSDKTEGEYDLVIGADGVKSRVRDLVFGSGFVHFADWRAFFFWTSQRPEIPQGVFEMIEHGAFCGIFAEMGNQSLVVLAIPAEHATFDNPEDRLLRLQQYFKDFSWQLPEIMKPLKAEDLLPTDIAFVIMDQWVKGRVALIGDAAHAMEPFAGMGSSMALEDAYVLADELSKTDSANIPQALLRYQERMRKRIEIARRQTRSIWWWTKIQSRIICTLRNLLMPYFPIKHFTKGYDYLLNRDV
jgi:2-polyprenyl-6-methoxyphenol hydroxylase-like FAD-dependent oxidoreductase